MRGLRVDAAHGVTDDERAEKQLFEVDLDLYLSLSAAGASDDLADSADYAAAVEAALSVLQGPPRRLLEALAAEVAEAVLADERVDAVTVAVRKMRPPLPHPLASAGVRLTRRRG